MDSDEGVLEAKGLEEGSLLSLVFDTAAFGGTRKGYLEAAFDAKEVKMKAEKRAARSARKLKAIKAGK